jgi:hypothetical protein
VARLGLAGSSGRTIPAENRWPLNGATNRIHVQQVKAERPARRVRLDNNTSTRTGAARRPGTNWRALKGPPAAERHTTRPCLVVVAVGSRFGRPDKLAAKITQTPLRALAAGARSFVLFAPGRKMIGLFPLIGRMGR